MKVYLAGAASQKFEMTCRAWRDFATEVLKRDEIETINPIKGYPLTKKYTRKEMFDIVEEDLNAIASCDLVLAEVGNLDHPYIGTSMEIKHAFNLDIPIVVWSRLEDNFFLEYHATKIYKTINGAVRFCREYNESIMKGAL